MINIYTLLDPNTKQIRYVGKTCQKLQVRLNRHIRDAKNKKNHKDCWIFSLLKKNQKPIIESLEEVIEENWQETEKFYIMYLRFLGFNLTNTLDGGEISVSVKYISKKLSIAGIGRKHTIQSKRKIGIANSGKKNGMYGIVVSKEEREKRRKFHTGKKMSQESIEKTRLSNLGRKNSEESRMKMRNSSPNKKILLQYSLDGNLINKWNSLGECSRINNFNKKNISNCCNNRSKTAYGFKWKYLTSGKIVKPNCY